MVCKLFLVDAIHIETGSNATYYTVCEIFCYTDIAQAMMAAIVLLVAWTSVLHLHQFPTHRKVEPNKVQWGYEDVEHQASAS